MSKNITLFLNKDSEKTIFDKIVISKNNIHKSAAFSLHYLSDANDSKNPNTIQLEDSEDLLDYLKDVFDLIENDIDTDSFISADIIIPEYPIVCMQIKNQFTQKLILNIVKKWSRRDTRY